MRFTRHAKNALRRLKRNVPKMSEEAVLTSLATAEAIGVDLKGNLKASIRLGGVEFIVVLDIERQVVVTLWER